MDADVVRDVVDAGFRDDDEGVLILEVEYWDRERVDAADEVA